MLRPKMLRQLASSLPSATLKRYSTITGCMPIHAAITFSRHSGAQLLMGNLQFTPRAYTKAAATRRINRAFATSSCINQSKIEHFILPDIGEGIKEVTIKEWLVNVGDQVSEFDPICEVESDKATVTISSRFTGKIAKVHYELGSMAQVGQPLVDIQLDRGCESTTNESERAMDTQKEINTKTIGKMINNTVEKPNESLEQNHSIATLPSVRRLARENGIDLSQVKPTGKSNRVLKEDVLNYLSNRATANQSSSLTAETNNQLQQNLECPHTRHVKRGEQNTSRVPMRTIQKAMYKSMTASLQVPHFNYSDEIDLTRLVGYLSERKSAQQKPTSSAFAFFVKLVSLALLEYPELNASIDHDNEHLVHKHYHNIGIAVDTKHGLIVPNIKNVETKTVTQVYHELARLRELAYSSKLSPQDLSGGTISLSNIGAIGGVFGVPVIVTPEIIIGALGRTRQLPRYNNRGEVEARHIMQVVWSADHRVVDGASLSRFSNLLKSLLEQPETAVERMT